MNSLLLRDHAGHQLYTCLRSAIEKGELQPGQRLASTKALQTQMKLSYHATIKGLEQLKNEGWITRRNGSGTFVRESRPAAADISPHTHALMLFHSMTTLPATAFLTPAVEAVRAEALARRLNLTEGRFELGDKNAHWPALPDHVEALIWVCPSPCYSVPERPKMPLVLISQDANTISSEEIGYDVILADSLQGGALAGRTLREQGCRKVTFLGVWSDLTNAWDPFSLQRLRGFEAGFGRALRPEELLRVSHYVVAKGAGAVMKILERGKPDGIFAASDDLATGVLHGLIAHGVTAGSDVKLIGFDGQPARVAEGPQLTTVAAPLEEMGRLAVRLALERLQRPDMPMRRVSLACNLKKGGTA